jgi:hypothetical protein
MFQKKSFCFYMAKNCYKFHDYIFWLTQMDVSKANPKCCTADISDKNFRAPRLPSKLSSSFHGVELWRKLVSNSPQILITLPPGEICKLPENANSASRVYMEREKRLLLFSPFRFSVKPKIRQKYLAKSGGRGPFFIPSARTLPAVLQVK